MPRHTIRFPYLLPFMLAELAVNAGETIVRRTELIATGRCTAAEYRRMVVEKAAAAQASMVAVANAPPDAALEAAVTPWLDSARANARRLRGNS
jgi:hypothetical protein